MEKQKPSIAAGIVFVLIGLFCACIGIMGIDSFFTEGNELKPYLVDKNSDIIIVTMKEASKVMMGVGFMGAFGLIGFGVYRMMPVKEEEYEGYDDEAYADEEYDDEEYDDEEYDDEEYDDEALDEDGEALNVDEQDSSEEPPETA
jgi:hypothetical protein